MEERKSFYKETLLSWFEKFAELFKNNWGSWIDLSIGNFASEVQLLQFRRHKNGKVQFRKEVIKGTYVPVPELQDLQKGSAPEGESMVFFDPDKGYGILNREDRHV